MGRQNNVPASCIPVLPPPTVWPFHPPRTQGRCLPCLHVATADGAARGSCTRLAYPPSAGSQLYLLTAAQGVLNALRKLAAEGQGDTRWLVGSSAHRTHRSRAQDSRLCPRASRAAIGSGVPLRATSATLGCQIAATARVSNQSKNVRSSSRCVVASVGPASRASPQSLPDSPDSQSRDQARAVSVQTPALGIILAGDLR